MPVENALVSVIVPVYNAEATLRRCIDSIIGQDYSSLELLLVNDGSRDQSLSILREYERRDPRVRVFTQTNKGVSSARNTGLRHASGAFIKFMDSDDVLPPHTLAPMVNVLETHRCHLVLGAYHEVVRGVKFRRGFLKADQVLTQQELLKMLSAHPNSFYYSVLWNKLYRRDIIQTHRVLFNENLVWGEDFAFNMQYMKYAKSIGVLAQPVYEYWRYIRGLAISNSLRSFLHPLGYIRMKLYLHQYYKQLYIETGSYETYRYVLPQHLFKFTINH